MVAFGIPTVAAVGILLFAVSLRGSVSISPPPLTPLYGLYMSRSGVFIRLAAETLNQCLFGIPGLFHLRAECLSSDLSGREVMPL